MVILVCHHVRDRTLGTNYPPGQFPVEIPFGHAVGASLEACNDTGETVHLKFLKWFEDSGGNPIAYAEWEGNVSPGGCVHMGDGQGVGVLNNSGPWYLRSQMYVNGSLYTNRTWYAINCVDGNNGNNNNSVRDGTLVAARAKADTWPDWQPIDLGQINHWPPDVLITTQWQIENTGTVTATFFGALKGIVPGTDLVTGMVELAPGQKGWVERQLTVTEGQYAAEFELRVFRTPLPGYDILENHPFTIVASAVSTFDLTLSASSGGSVTAIIGAAQWTVPAGQTIWIYDIEAGSTVNLKGNPQAGYDFKRWDGGPVDGNTNPEVTFPMNADYHVSGVFEAEPYPGHTLTLSASAGGSVTAIIGAAQWTVPAGQTIYIYDIDQGSFVDLKGNPQAGYDFKHWQGQPVDGNTNPEVTFPMNADYEITGVFEGEAPDRNGTLAAARAKADTWPDWQPIDLGQVNRWPPDVVITTQWQIENTGTITATFFGALKGIVPATDLLTSLVELAPGQKGWVERQLTVTEGQYAAEFELRVFRTPLPGYDILENHPFTIITEELPPDTGGLRGRVLDKNTGDPIDLATVQSGPHQGTTGPDGWYEIDDIPAGTWQFTYSAAGYHPEEHDVNIVAEHWTRLDVLMTPEDEELPDREFPWLWFGIGAAAVAAIAAYRSRRKD